MLTYQLFDGLFEFLLFKSLLPKAPRGPRRPGIVDGHVYLSPEITGVLVKNYKSALSDSSALALLTAREREVLQLFAEGQSPREIADIIHLSLKTVEAYRRQIMNKLGFKRLAELIKFAIREGLTFLDH
jgi:DNA-binding NarL/FixJ family response regulator